MVAVSYFDTSAAFKLLVEERETAALRALLEDDRARRLYSSMLLHTELYCAAGRSADAINVDEVGAVLDGLELVDLERADLISAASHAPLRSQDAIHLSVALRIGGAEIITYDEELADAARRTGIEVVCPA